MSAPQLGRHASRPRVLISALICSTLVVSLLPVASDDLASTARAKEAPPAQEVDLDELQTPTAETTVNPDGSFTTELFTSPVQYETDSGEWAAIDPTLVPTTEDGYNYTNNAGDLDVLLDAAASEQLLRLEDGDNAISLELEGAAASPAAVDDSRITYADVFAGADLRYDVTSDGVKETIVLSSSAAPSSYRFTLTGPENNELDAQQRPDGSWEFLSDNSDDPAFTLAAPTVHDSAAEPAVGPATMTVQEKGSTFTIDLSVDAAWLAAPEREFPVLLDPTITVQSPNEFTDDAQFDWAALNTALTTPNRLALGTDATHRYRAGLKFDVSGIPGGATIQDAAVKLFWPDTCITGAANCGGAHTFDIHEMLKPWETTPTPTKPSQLSPGGWGPTLASYTLASGVSAPKWITFSDPSLTSTVSDWVAGTDPNYGFFVNRSPDSAYNLSGPKVLGKRITGDATLKPTLEVTWLSAGSTLYPPQVVHSTGAELNWSRYLTVGAPFATYEVHRAAGSSNFTPSDQTLIATIGDADVTSYTDTTAAAGSTFTYKIVTTYTGTSQKDPSNKQTVTTPTLDGSGRTQTTATLQSDPADGKATYLTYYQNPSTNPPDRCNNFGAGTWLRIGTTDTRRYRPVLWFDLRRIPTDANVTEAKLQLYHETTAEEFAVDVHRVTRDWREGTGSGSCTGDGATWYETQGGVKWSAEGGDRSAQIATMAAKARTSPGWDTFDLKNSDHDGDPATDPQDVFSPWIRGDEPNFGVLIKRANDSGLDGGFNFAYFSDDYAAAPTLRPKLQLTYADPDASAPIKPTVSIGAPAPGATAGGTVKLTAAAADDGNIERVEFLIDDVVVGTPDTTEPFALDWSSGTNGLKVVKARATDDAGHTVTSAPVSFTYDSSAPTSVAVTSPSQAAA